MMTFLARMKVKEGIEPDFVRLANALTENAAAMQNFVQQPGIGEKMKKALPNAVFVGTFGMTETAGTVTTSRLDATEEQRFTRLGTPLSGIEVKAINPESGEEAATGDRGEAWIRGYCTFTILQITGENRAGT